MVGRDGGARVRPVAGAEARPHGGQRRPLDPVGIKRVPHRAREVQPALAPLAYAPHHQHAPVGPGAGRAVRPAAVDAQGQRLLGQRLEAQGRVAAEQAGAQGRAVRQHEVERPRRVRPHRHRVDHEAPLREVAPLGGHAHQEPRYARHGGIAREFGVEALRVAAHVRAVVRRVLVVGDDPHHPFAARQQAGARRGEGAGEVRVGVGARGLARQVELFGRPLHRSRVVGAGVAHVGRGAAGNLPRLVEGRQRDGGVVEAALSHQRRDQRAEGRAGVGVEGLHPAGVLHEVDLADGRRRSRRWVRGGGARDRRREQRREQR